MYKSPISLALAGILLVNAVFIHLLSLSMLIQASPIANQITATTTADVMDAFDGQCSLREALHNANNNAQYSSETGECAAGDSATTDVIVLQGGETYLLTISGDNEDEGDLNVWPSNTAAIDLRLEANGDEPAVIQMTLPGYRVMQNDGATVEIVNIVLSGGAVDGPGGGILNQSGGYLTLTNVALYDNGARHGGGLYNLGTAVLVNSQIMTNTAAINGGGAVNSGGGSLTLDGSQVSGNTANQNGGGIYHLDDPSTLTITSGDIINNTAVNGDGGGLFMLADATINYSGFGGNTAVNGVGGGVYNGGAILTGQEAALTGNRALAGGGMYNANGGVYLTGGSFVDNQALTTHGGGLYAHGGMAELDLAGIIFQANKADSGAGLYLATGTTTHLRQTAVVHNDASEMGGGIFLQSDLTMGNVTLSGNSAADNGGGLYIDEDGTATAVNVTLVLDGPTQNLYSLGELTLQNSVVSGSSADCNLPDAPITSLGHNLTNIAACAGLDHAADLFAANLLLAPLDNYYSDQLTYALLPGSPALNAADAGACAAAPVNGFDQRSLRRPYGPGCDIGAHEEQLPLQIYLPLITAPN